MSVTSTGGDPRQRPFHTTEALAGSTTTDVSLTTDVTTLASGEYSLANGTEGQWKEILMSADGEASFSLTGTATGNLVLTEEDDYILARFTSGKWRLIQSSATIA